MTAVQPQGVYRTAVVVGQTITTAGITPRDDAGRLLRTGVVGDGGIALNEAGDLAAAAATRAVRACQQALPNGGRLTHAVSLLVYVRADPHFVDHTAVADEASRAVVDQIGGLAPARTAVGVASLPGGSPLEVQLTCEWE